MLRVLRVRKLPAASATFAIPLSLLMSGPPEQSYARDDPATAGRHHHAAPPHQREGCGRRRHRGCRHRQSVPMQLSSPAFADGGSLPPDYSCTGQSISPPLSWGHVPPRARELELLVTDPDAPTGPVSHWVVYAIPPSDRGAPQGSAPAGAAQGTNSAGLRSYLPPCPLPPGSTHHYIFELFASAKPLSFGDSPNDAEVRAALKGNTLASARLVATYALGG